MVGSATGGLCRYRHRVARDGAGDWYPHLGRWHRLSDQCRIHEVQWPGRSVRDLEPDHPRGLSQREPSGVYSAVITHSILQSEGVPT